MVHLLILMLEGMQYIVPDLCLEPHKQLFSVITSADETQFVVPPSFERACRVPRELLPKTVKP